MCSSITNNPLFSRLYCRIARAQKLVPGIFKSNTTRSMSSSTNELPPSSTIPLFATISAYREWRTQAFETGKSVGFVPTMGALHEGHLSLVRRSLAENDLTVVSIFVNPGQFAPHEDLTSYPRTLSRDLELLSAEKVTVPNSLSSSAIPISRTPSAVFVPSVSEIYPSGIVQNVAEQKGAFVEVKGYSHQMEGQSRPTFFRGVATVVTKLFNVIQPTRAYFGQKDIQQALVLKRLCRDLLFSYPEPDNLRIIPTSRDPSDDLALSSRNAYLTSNGRKFAPTLIQALRAAETGWARGLTKAECIERATTVVTLSKAKARLENLRVDAKLEYIEMNDADSFEVLGPHIRRSDVDLVILSGALNVEQTRLIDNILLGAKDRVLG